MSKKSKALKRRGIWITKQYFSNRGPHPLAMNMENRTKYTHRN